MKREIEILQITFSQYFLIFFSVLLTFVQNMAVKLPCFVQNFKEIG